MGLEALAIGGLAAGALGGAAKGLAGTPTQTQTGSSTQTTSLAPMTQTQQDLQGLSLQNYLQQLDLANQYQNSIGGAQGIQDQARQAAGGVLSGQAFNLTPQEQSQLGQIRQNTMDQGTTDINRLLDQRLQGLQASAASRGVRGQALSQLQGQTTRYGAQAVGDLARSANQIYAQQALNLPFQRLQAQNPYIMGGMSMADQMRLQAQQNRITAQNPYLLNMLQNERLATATRTTNQTGQQIGQPGNFWDALGGGLAGAGSGLATGALAGAALNSLGGAAGGNSFGGGSFGSGGGQQQPTYNWMDPNGGYQPSSYASGTPWHL